MDRILQFISNLFGSIDQFDGFNLLVGFVLLLLAVLVGTWLARYLLVKRLLPFVQRVRPVWGDILVERKLPHEAARLTPGIVILITAPFFLWGHDRSLETLSMLAALYVVAISTHLLASTFKVLELYYERTFDYAKDVPLTGLVQICTIVVYLVGGLLLLSIVLGIPSIYILGGLGALGVVASYIFKDPLLGLGASLQLAMNKMIAIGDWIEMPEYGADGDVKEINLTSVKVQNWDRTITTVPTYALVTHSFKNWRAMQEGGGRRIFRALLVDVSTIRPCKAKNLLAGVQSELVAAYLQGIDEVAPGMDGTGPRTTTSTETNLNLFITYAEYYLRHHDRIHREMLCLVRQLDPTPYGLPVQVYAFTNTTLFPAFNAIQDEIFAHLYAVLPDFGLRAFQVLGGSDFKTAAYEDRISPPEIAQPSR